MKKPIEDRKWEGSYTQAVVLSLQRSWQVASTTPGNSVYEAVQLLRQYHRDLHIPYEQRDAARRTSAIFKKAAEHNSKENKRLYLREQQLLNEIANLRAELTAVHFKPPSPPQPPPLKEELQMARGVAAGNNLYDVVRAIDRAIEEIKPFKWTVYQ